MATAEKNVTGTTAGTGVSVWQIDPAHSDVEFSVKHLMVTKVKGRFSGVAGTIKLDENNPGSSSVDVTIDATTVDTRQEQRDAHLRSADFFDVEKYATIEFHSTSVKFDGDDLELTGDLTMHGVTRPV